MRIDYNDAWELERIVRRVFQCQSGGMFGYITTTHFETHPFDAALIALAELWQKAEPNEIGDFLTTWDLQLRNDEENENIDNIDIKPYVEGLDRIVTAIMERSVNN